MESIKRMAKEGTDFTHRTTCRTCGSSDVYRFLSLGFTPLANSIIKKDSLQEEVFYPLDVYVCRKCHLVQLMDVVPPHVMFKEYAYLSGSSQPLKAHFSDLAADAISKVGDKGVKLVVDIGSNDGTLLQCFRSYGLRTLGVEPATNIAKLAEERGISTMNTFFNAESAAKIRDSYGTADIITATNVFAHIDDLGSVLKGIDRLLSDTGVFVIEMPYILNLLANVEFDTIYHEHLSYFGLHPLLSLFHEYNFGIADVRQIPIHGGSIRVFVQRSPALVTRNVKDMIAMEQSAALDSLQPYNHFALQVTRIRETLIALLTRLKAGGARISGYGATAKGNTLLNYCNIGPEMLDYISDTTPLKQYHLTPGMHIPIVPEEVFHASPPNYSLLLAWNYADEILRREYQFREAGGKFILPFPEPHII